MKYSFVSHAFPRCRTQAVTLIEILVVVAIMGALLALLLPGLAMARNTLNSIRCTSNLKQIYVSSCNWSADHDGWVPQAAWFQGANYKNNLLGYGLSNSVVLNCPAAKTTNSYGINIRLVSGSPMWGDGNNTWYNYRGRYKFAALPSSVLFFTETISSGSTYSGFYYSHPTYMNFPHNKQANVLYIDGHVDKLPSSTLTNIAAFTNGVPDSN
jgi:prepilin-type processing-associated H-X9-DG protein